MEEKNKEPRNDVQVTIVRKCKNCGQILSENAQDCWKCSSTDINETAEEVTEELTKDTLEAKIDKVMHEFKTYKIVSIVMIVLCAILVLLWIIK